MIFENSKQWIAEVREEWDSGKPEAYFDQGVEVLDLLNDLFAALDEVPDAGKKVIEQFEIVHARRGHLP